MAEAHDPPRSRRLIELIAIERAIRGLVLAAAGIAMLAAMPPAFQRPPPTLLGGG